MKQKIYSSASKIFLLLLILLVNQTSFAQNLFPSTGAVGIGTTTPKTSSLLEIKSISKGILLPRMTKNQRDAILSPDTSLLIYQTTNTPGFYYYSGTAWTAVSPKGVNKTLSNLTGPTAVNVSLLPAISSSIDLGSLSLPWKDIYFTNGIYTANGIVFTADANNTATGLLSLNSNTIGVHNTANGYGALYYNTKGSHNTANGYLALAGDSTGSGNTANGDEALVANTTGSSNTANGADALVSNTTGYGNTANGASALQYNVTGSYNVADGSFALFNNTGINNTAVGFNALENNAAGSNNTGVGYLADVSLGYLTNAAAIGTNALANANNKIVIGENLAGIVIGGYANWTNLSDGRFKENIKEDVPGLKFITKLRPITYTINTKKLEDHIMQNMPDSSKAKRRQKPEDYARAAKKIQTGFVAQEVEKAARELNYDFDGVNAPQNPTDNYSIAYSQFVIPLVKAVQELNKMNDDKDEKINDLQKQIDELKLLITLSQTTSANTQTESSQLVILDMVPKLEQNIPNPFSKTTTINYYLPVNKGNAYINFYSAAGAVLKSVKLVANGKGTITLKANELPSGTYQYALVVDGKNIDSKQMILAK